MSSIYILRLTHNKYYVGKTKNHLTETTRLLSHIRGTGAFWTRKYPPLEVMHIYQDCHDFDELKYTLDMMYKYGIDNVRGAEYVTEHLTEQQKTAIQKSIANAKDLCLRCYKKGHYISECPEKEKPIPLETNYVPLPDMSDSPPSDKCSCFPGLKNIFYNG
jgi:hypothetical protein